MRSPTLSPIHSPRSPRNMPPLIADEFSTQPTTGSIEQTTGPKTTFTTARVGRNLEALKLLNINSLVDAQSTVFETLSADIRQGTLNATTLPHYLKACFGMNYDSSQVSTQFSQLMNELSKNGLSQLLPVTEQSSITSAVLFCIFNAGDAGQGKDFFNIKEYIKFIADYLHMDKDIIRTCIPAQYVEGIRVKHTRAMLIKIESHSFECVVRLYPAQNPLRSLTHLYDGYPAVLLNILLRLPPSSLNVFSQLCHPFNEIVIEGLPYWKDRGFNIHEGDSANRSKVAVAKFCETCRASGSEDLQRLAAILMLKKAVQANYPTIAALLQRETPPKTPKELIDVGLITQEQFDEFGLRPLQIELLCSNDGLLALCEGKVNFRLLSQLPEQHCHAYALLNADFVRALNLYKLILDIGITSPKTLYRKLIQEAINDNVPALILLIQKGALGFDQEKLSALGFNQKKVSTALIEAIKAKKIKSILYLIPFKDEGDGKTNQGETALMAAVVSQSLDIVKQLIKLKPSLLNLIDHEGNTALMIAAKSSNNVEIVMELMNAGAKYHVKNIQGHTALMIAVLEGNYKVVEALIRKDVLVIFARDKVNYTALDHARLQKQKWIEDLLFRFSTENALNITKLLCEAAQNGHIEVIEDLLAAGADLNALIPSENFNALLLKRGIKNALHSAAIAGHFEIVEILIRAGADLEKKDGGPLRRTALWWATVYRRAQTVKVLANAGAKLDEKEEKCTVLIWAAYKNDVETVKVLAEAGANLDEKDENSKTALLHAAEKGNVAIVKILVDAGAKLDEKDTEYTAALAWAAYHGHVEIVKILVKAGANLEMMDEQKRTALYYAILYRDHNPEYREIAKILSAAGAKCPEGWESKLKEALEANK